MSAARKRVSERLQQYGVNDNYLTQGSAVSGSSGSDATATGSASNGYDGESGVPTGSTSDGRCTVPCERYSILKMS